MTAGATGGRAAGWCWQSHQFADTGKNIGQVFTAGLARLRQS